MCVKGQSSLHVVAWGVSTASEVKAEGCGEKNLGLLPVGTGTSLGILRQRLPKCGSYELSKIQPGQWECSNVIRTVALDCLRMTRDVADRLDFLYRWASG